MARKGSLFYVSPKEKCPKEREIAGYLNYLEMTKGSRLSKEEWQVGRELYEKRLQDDKAEKEAQERLGI